METSAKLKMNILRAFTIMSQSLINKFGVTNYNRERHAKI